MNRPITERDINRMTDRDREQLHDKARKLRCPTCGAPPGSGCAFLPGLAYVMYAYHLPRYQAVDAHA